jgi:coenzyme F420 hydrogenase subunit beta
MIDETIAQVVKDELCTGCGTCIALCPNEAIKLTINEKKGIYVPELNEEKCNSCGICLKVCPGYEVDFKELNLEIFGKEPEDALIGNYLSCYIGHATDYNIRYNSSSGGLVTQLLIFALEEGIIDGTLVTRMKKDKPLEPEVIVARTEEEIISAMGSKYCPVPANIGLKEILKEDGRFAVVGLPCHIHGIRKAERINKNLKEKIVLHLGLLCGHAPNFMGTEFFLKKLNIKKKDVKKIDYRGKGWPGNIAIILKDNSKIVISRVGSERSRSININYETAFHLHFFQKRCLVCCDGICELADISFGDTWRLPEFVSDEKIGKSLIISKTEIGESLLQNAMYKRKIELENIVRDKTIQSQEEMLLFHKNLKSRILLFKIFGKHVPRYNTQLLKPKITDYLTGMFYYFATSISEKRYLWFLLNAFTFLYQKIYLFSLACLAFGKRKLKEMTAKLFRKSF